jgi:hypothetical protein
MKIIKQIIREMGNKKTVLSALAIIAFGSLVFAGFNTALDDTKAQVIPDGCNPFTDLQVEGGSIAEFDVFQNDYIDFQGGTAQVAVTNTSATCSYNLGLASYEITKGGLDLSDPDQRREFILTQELFDQDLDTMSPGEVRTFTVNIPQCTWQVDFFLGTSAPTPPDFENLNSTHRLLGATMFWEVDSSLQVCGDNPECPANPDWERDIVFTTTNPVVDNDPFAHTVIKMLNGETMAEVTLTNTSECHSYTFGLASYKTFTEWGTVSSQEFIENQELFDDDIQTVGPGEDATFRVDLPQCTWQVDFFLGDFAPAIPDFAELEQQGTHDLIDAVIYKDVTSGLLVCGFVEEQCPADFNPEVTITSPSTLSVTAGGTVDYLVTGVGDGEITFSVPNASKPSWLTYNSATRRVTGTVPTNFTGPVEFTINAVAINTANDEQCGQGSKVVTITTAQCPVAPPAITGNATASGTVGTPFSYTFSTTGTVTSIVAGNLPPGISRTGNTLSGTPTVAGTYNATITVSNECGSDELDVQIVISSPECPADFVKPLINGQADGSESFTIKAGDPVNYSYTVTGDGTKVIAITSLPTGLVHNEAQRTVTGTMPNQKVDFTLTVDAKDEASGDICGIAKRVITLNPQTVNNQCPSPFADPNVTSASTIEAEEGDEINYKITFTSGDGDVDLPPEVNNLPSWLDYDEDDLTITGEMPDDDDYSFTITLVSRDDEERQCGDDVHTVTIEGEDRGCPGCGGGRSEPRVRASSRTFPGEVLGSQFVVLSDVPETGFGNIQSIIFTLGLLIISAGIAYLIMSPRMRAKVSGVFGGADDSYNSYSYSNYPDNGGGDDYGHASVADVASFPIVPTYGTSQSREREVNQRFEEIRRGAHALHEQGVDEDFSSRIAQDMQALRQKEVAREESDPFAITADNVDTSALQRIIEEQAKASQTLISDDGVKLIVKAANAKEENALPILNELIRVADGWYAREDGWLLLNKTKIKEVLFATYVMMVPVFIGWIAEGNQKKAFSFLRMLRSQEHSLKEFIKYVVYELDSLYRHLADGGVGESKTDEHTKKVASHWKKEDIESMIETTVGSVDETYSNDLTSIKLSVLRLFSIADEAKRGKAMRLSSGK